MTMLPAQLRWHTANPFGYQRNSREKSSQTLEFDKYAYKRFYRKFNKFSFFIRNIFFCSVLFPKYKNTHKKGFCAPSSSHSLASGKYYRYLLTIPRKVWSQKFSHNQIALYNAFIDWTKTLPFLNFQKLYFSIFSQAVDWEREGDIVNNDIWIVRSNHHETGSAQRITWRNITKTIN